MSKGRGETGDHRPPWAERPAPRPWGGSVPALTRDSKEARLLSCAPSRAWTTLYLPAAPPMDACEECSGEHGMLTCILF